MVSLAEVYASNALIASTFPPGLVAVFVGATSGIGEVTLKTFAKYANRPRVYFVGRSQEAADRIVKECMALNPGGEYVFVKADVSLIRAVDEVCQKIKAKEKVLNILFLSAGVAALDRRETSEQLHHLTALIHYSRLRFMINLLPLIRNARNLRRVVTVAGGGREGLVDTTDFQALRVPLVQIRGHLTTLVTLGLEAMVRSAPEVSFVHDYPGTVNTSLLSHAPGILHALIRAYIKVLGPWVCVPIEESGERHLYLATSSRFPPASRKNEQVQLDDAVETAIGSNGVAGSGVYSVGWDCASSLPPVLKILAEQREYGLIEAIMKHTEGEYQRITGGV